MKLSAWLIQVIIFSFISTAHADSGGIAGDINFDNKIGLEEAIYALQVVAGLKTVERTLDPFEVYRADVVRELKKLGTKQAYYRSEYNYYANNINEIQTSPLWPDMNFSIIMVSADYFKIKATHNKLSDYYWTYDSGLNFEENGNAFKPEMEIFELYRGQVISKLMLLVFNQDSYKAEFGTYQADASITEFSPDQYPDVTLVIINADENSFVIEGSHAKIKGYAWRINNSRQINTAIISE